MYEEMVMGFSEDNPAVMFLADHCIQKDIFAFVDTGGSFGVQPGDIADFIKMSVDVDENMKMQIINNRMPRANFKFPERQYVDKSRKKPESDPCIVKLLGLKDTNSLPTQ